MKAKITFIALVIGIGLFLQATHHWSGILLTGLGTGMAGWMLAGIALASRNTSRASRS